MKKRIATKKVKEHGENLNVIFKTGIDPITLYNKLSNLDRLLQILANENNDNENNIILTEMKGRSFLFPALKGNDPDKKREVRKSELYKSVKMNYTGNGPAFLIDSDYVKKHDLFIATNNKGEGVIAPLIKDY